MLRVHHSGHIGVNAPPRAASYEEWVQQNELMEGRMIESSFRELPASGGESGQQ